jgi:hypothetical protein
LKLRFIGDSMLSRSFSHCLVAAIALITICDVSYSTEATVADEQLVSAGFFGGTKALVMTPPQPKAVAVLYAGGPGALKLSGKTGAVTMGMLQYNFLIASRRRFFARDIAVVAMESPAGRDMTPLNRINAASDTKTMVEHLQKTGVIAANLPVWAVGTSAGTISAVAVAISSPEILSGLVLTASNTRQAGARGVWADANPHGIASMDIGKFNKPVLALSHELDACVYTPPSDTQHLADQFVSSPRRQAIVMTEKISPDGDPCEADSPHGFSGAEEQAVGRIVDFMLRPS